MSAFVGIDVDCLLERQATLSTRFKAPEVLGWFAELQLRSAPVVREEHIGELLKRINMLWMAISLGHIALDPEDQFLSSLRRALHMRGPVASLLKQMRKHYSTMPPAFIDFEEGMIVSSVVKSLEAYLENYGTPNRGRRANPEWHFPAIALAQPIARVFQLSGRKVSIFTREGPVVRLISVALLKSKMGRAGPETIGRHFRKPEIRKAIGAGTISAAFRVSTPLPRVRKGKIGGI